MYAGRIRTIRATGMGEKSMETSRERCEEQNAVKRERQAMPNLPPQRQTEIDRSYVLHTKRLYWLGRRAQDIILSLIALLILWPLMLIVALVIWIDSPGTSPIFAQERVGRDGKRFMFLNLRWMQVVCELHKIQATIQTIICRRYTEFSLSSDFRHSIAGFAGVFAA